MEVYPGGTVTFLFTDVEGSTTLWEQCPDGMQPCMARHDAILRTTVGAHGGHIVKATGDGIHAVFETATQAVQAAVAAQQALAADRWPEIHPSALRVRMGLHSGEAELRAGDYYGAATNRAARLMSVGHGGQVLISQATAELIRDRLPPRLALAPLGEHRLKDLSRPEQIFQLVHPDLPSKFPPLKTLDETPNNLPIQLTSFVGREREVDEVKTLLNSHRVVSLTGSGGTGKTRLAQEVAARVLELFPGGAWLVELAPLTDATQVIPTLAQVFGLKEGSFNTLEDLVVEYLRSRQLLLILDNCEHMVAACARLADRLARQCPRLKIIVSSREALGIAGEAAYRIPSLAESEAVQLFEERARATHATFRLTPANTAVVNQICRRLDGIPLAIELAAARARLLTPEQIAARLNDRFRLLVGGSRTALPRQQTLRAMIDWSYDLLAEDEKRLLRTASVFAGGWTLEALETIADDSLAFDNLEQLVNKSLVSTEEQAGAMRYYLLETIRQYAREKLLDEGTTAAAQVRARHLAYFVKLASTSFARLMGSEMAAALDELELEQDNLRSAIEWALETDPISALSIGGLLPSFWGRRLSAKEGLTWISSALERAESLPQARKASLDYQRARAWGLLGKVTMAFQLGDTDESWSTISDSIDLAREVEDYELLAYDLAVGATIAGFRGDISTARAWAQEAQELSTRYNFLYSLANVVGMEMFIAVVADLPIPTGLIEKTISTAHASGNPWVLALALANVGRVWIRQGRWEEAASLLEEAITLSRQIRDRAMANMSRSEMGHLLRAQGRFEEAAAVYRETIFNFKDWAQYAAVAHELECFAFIATAQEKPERAARLLGAAEALREKNRTDMTAIERREYETILAQLRGHLQEKAFSAAWAEGRGLTLDQAIELALEKEM